MSTVAKVRTALARDATRHRPGEFQDATEEVLALAVRPMRVSDIREGVETRLGGTVAASSIRNYLRLNASADSHFTKEQHGVCIFR